MPSWPKSTSFVSQAASFLLERSPSRSVVVTNLGRQNRSCPPRQRRATLPVFYEQRAPANKPGRTTWERLIPPRKLRRDRSQRRSTSYGEQKSIMSLRLYLPLQLGSLARSSASVAAAAVAANNVIYEDATITCVCALLSGSATTDPTTATDRPGTSEGACACVAAPPPSSSLGY